MNLILKILTLFLNFHGFSTTKPLKFRENKTLKLRENVELCSNISLYKFMDPPPTGLTGLVGMPGAGNHWVLHLLRMATGIHTSKWFQDEDEYFPYNHVWNSSVLLIKDHMMVMKDTTYDIMEFSNRPFQLNL